MCGRAGMNESPSRRLLAVLPEIPDPTVGGGRLLAEILEFASQSWEIDAVVPVEPHLRQRFEAIAAAQSLAAVRWHVIQPAAQPGVWGSAMRHLSLMPAAVQKYANSKNFSILERVRERLSPDTELLVSTWAMAAYRNAELPSNSRLYMVNTDHEIVRYYGASLRRKAAAWLERRKVKRLCGIALRKAGRAGAISEADIPLLSRLGRRTDIRNVPPIMRPITVSRDQVQPYTVLITTNFTYGQNVVSLDWFLSHVWPRVDSRARLTITGRDEGGQLARLCSAVPRVSYAGCLDSEEFDREFSRTALVVNPTRTGSGFQIKLLDALARGVPVVSTSFSNRIGRVIPSSDDPQLLAALISNHLVPSSGGAFCYDAYYSDACRAWDEFLVHPGSSWVEP